MPKLKDTQLVILSAAAQRDGGGALPLPKSLKIKGAALAKTLDQLRKQGLLEEKPAPHGAAAWREGEDGGRMMLSRARSPAQRRTRSPSSRKRRSSAIPGQLSTPSTSVRPRRQLRAGAH